MWGCTQIQHSNFSFSSIFSSFKEKKANCPVGKHFNGTILCHNFLTRYEAFWWDNCSSCTTSLTLLSGVQQYALTSSFLCLTSLLELFIILSYVYTTFLRLIIVLRGGFCPGNPSGWPEGKSRENVEGCRVLR